MAESILDILFRTKKTGSGDKDATTGLQNLSGAFEQVTGVSLTAAGAFAAVAGALKYSIDQAVAAEQVQAQLDAVLQSTGGAAGMTAEEINRMAEELSSLSAVEDETIVAASALMLTFTQIKEDVFPDAMQAALDMSQALGQDLNTSVMQLGKALNDPIQGLTALRRVGVSFTDEQEEMIKTLVESGQAMEAQKLILEELNTEFGGSAAAAAGTYAGQLQKLQNNVDNLAEAFGTGLLPILNSALSTMVLLTEAVGKINSVMDSHEQAIMLSGATYQEYVEEVKRARQEAGIFGLFIEIMSQQQYEGAQATLQWASAEREAAYAAQYAGEQAGQYALATDASAASAEAALPAVEGLGNAYSAAAGEAGLAATSAHEMAGASERLASAEQELKTAQDELATAQENWAKGAGGQIAGMLEQAGLKGDKLYAALSVVDTEMGTSELATAKTKDQMKLLVEQYAETGKIDAFKEGLVDLKETFGPLDETIASSMALVDELQGKLNDMARVYHVVVRTEIEGGTGGSSGNGGGGGGGGGGGNDYMGGDDEIGPGVNPGAGFAPGALVIQNVNINNGMDLEELRWTMAQWMGGR